MNDLERSFHANAGNLIHKWHHFFDIHERHFARFRGQPVHMLEIGVYQGGSLQMWKDYFGPQARIYGIDINPACRELEEDRVKIFIGDQEDRAFLHAWHSREPARLAVNDFTRSTDSLHFYDSGLAIEKRPIEPPVHSKTGTAHLPDYRPPRGPGSAVGRALRRLAGR